MSDFKAKVQQIRFPWGSGSRGPASDSAGGAHSAPPKSLAVFNGPILKGREKGEGRELRGEGKAKKKEGERRGGKGRKEMERGREEKV